MIPVLAASIALAVTWFFLIKINKRKKTEMATNTHDISVEIIGEVTKKKERAISDRNFQYPTNELWGGPLVTRGQWMLTRKEWWVFSVEPANEEGIEEIKLESWLRTRRSHQLLFEYGRVFRTIINWDGWMVTANIIATHPLIPVEDMPNVLEVGQGVAFVIGGKAWDAYKEKEAELLKEGEVPAGRKLLYHCLLDRDLVGEDFNVKRFSEWPASMILDLVSRRIPGAKYRTFSPIEAGLMEDPERAAAEAIEVAIKAARNEIPQECLLVEDRAEVGVEPEGSKTKSPTHFVFPDVGNSPALTRKAKRRNDTDEHPRRKKKRVKGPRAPGSRPRKWKKKVPASPLQLTIEQERGIVKTLVLGLDPEASEAWIKFNQDAVAKRPEGVPDEQPGPYRYGSGPGGWNLGKEEEEATLREVSGSPRSSILSPRAELSQQLNSSAAGETPFPKKLRRDTECESDMSVSMSPFLTMHSAEGKIISISSSSPSSDDEGRKRVRVNLGELLGSGRIRWPEGGVFSQIQVEMTEEAVANVENGECNQENASVAEGQDQALEEDFRE